MRRVLLLVTSLAVSLFAAELVLRSTDAVNYRPLPSAPGNDVQGGGRLVHQASATEGLDYELVPDLSTQWRQWTIRTNSHGMRDRRPRRKSRQLIRIAAVGDSFSFGWGVAGKKAYPNVLERLLNEGSGPSVKFDVLNFGVSGYSTRDEAVVLEAKVRPWKPDLVVLGFVLNDAETAPLQPLPNVFAPVQWWQHSHLMRLLAQARPEWDIRRQGGGDYHRYLYDEARHWAALEGSFDHFRNTADEMGVKVVMVIFPHIPSPTGSWSDYPYEDIHERVTALGWRNGFTVIDLYPRFKKERPRRFGVTEDDRHPNAFGHYLAARALEYRLRHQLRDEIVPAS